MTYADTTRLPRTFVRFATVGVANTLIDVVVFWALQPALGVLTANFLSTSAGMTFSFWMNGRHTFGSSRVTGRQAGLFLATNGFTMWLLQPLLIVAARDLVGVPLPAAKVLALGGSVATNFLLYRYLVWPLGAGSAAGPEGRGSGVGADRLSEPTTELAKS